MNRRQALTTVGLGTAGFITGAGFTAPACGVSKDKAVKVTGFVIDLCKESTPLFQLLGAGDLAGQVSTKVIPALEKLKDFLSRTDIPQADSTLATVRSILSSVGTGLLNLPDSARRTTIIGILASVNVLLLTVEAFVESESTTPSAGVSAMASDNKLLKVFQATRL